MSDNDSFSEEECPGNIPPESSLSAFDNMIYGRNEDAAATDDDDDDDDFFESLRKTQKKNDSEQRGRKHHQGIHVVDTTPKIMFLDTDHDRHHDVPELIENISPTSVDASVSSTISEDKSKLSDSPTNFKAIEKVPVTSNSQTKRVTKYLTTTSLVTLLLLMSAMDLSGVTWLSNKARDSKPTGVSDTTTIEPTAIPLHNRDHQVLIREPDQKVIFDASDQERNELPKHEIHEQGQGQGQGQQGIYDDEQNATSTANVQDLQTKTAIEKFAEEDVSPNSHSRSRDQQEVKDLQQQVTMHEINQANVLFDKMDCIGLKDLEESDSLQQSQNGHTPSDDLQVPLYESKLLRPSISPSTEISNSDTDQSDLRTVRTEMFPLMHQMATGEKESLPSKEGSKQKIVTLKNENRQEYFSRLTKSLESVRLKVQTVVPRAAKQAASVAINTCFHLIREIKHIAQRANQITHDLGSTRKQIEAKSHSVVGGQESLKQLMQDVEHFAQRANQITENLASRNRRIQRKSKRIVGGQESIKHVRNVLRERSSRIISRRLEVSFFDDNL